MRPSPQKVGSLWQGPGLLMLRQKACVYNMCPQELNKKKNNNNIFNFGKFVNLSQWPFLDIQGGVTSSICILPD